jgi:hypothetical protein
MNTSDIKNLAILTEALRGRKNWPDTEPTTELQTQLSKRFGGKAKVIHAPYALSPYARATQEDFWFTILLFNNNHLRAISKSINDLERTLDFELITTVVKKLPSNDHIINDINKYYSIHEIDRNTTEIILFFQPKTVESKQQRLYYHVTAYKDAIENGLEPLPSVKYHKRIFLWDSLEPAKYFAQMASARTGAGRQSTLYILEVEPIGKIYDDHEELNASYSTEPIPPSNIKVIDVVNKT